MTVYKPLVNGTFPEVDTRFPAINPATGEELATIPECAELVDQTVEAGLVASAAWREVPLIQRSAILGQLANLIDEHAEELAELDVLDTGSPITAMRNDLRFATILMRQQIGMAPDVMGKGGSRFYGDHVHFTLPQPYGVVARFCAFNHPAMFSIMRIAAPLLMGNALIIKPSEHTSMSSLRLGEIIAPQLPAGLVSILTGAQPVGRAIVGHHKIKRISLTGSKRAASAFYQIAAESGDIKHFSFELGGKNPLIIYPDADLERACTFAVTGMNFNQSAGQSCGSTTRIFIHRDIYDAAKEQIRQLCEQIQPGDPMKPETQMGAISTPQQFDKVLHYIRISREEGLPLLTGGERLTQPPFDQGFFLLPTVFYDVDRNHTLFHEEVFGPVLALIPWDDEAEMIEAANDAEYGLTGGVWTRDIDTAMQVAQQLDTGMVWINGSANHFPGFGFAGHKNSGVGSEEDLEELYSFAQMKGVHVYGAKARAQQKIGL